MQYISYARSLLLSCRNALMVKVSSCAKISYMLGSYAAFFSLSGVMLPVIGAFHTRRTIFMSVFMMCVMRMMCGLSVMTSLAFWVPGLCAALYWRMARPAYRIGLPVLCMILFVAHPVGASAWMYAVPWIVPMIAYTYHKQYTFVHAWASTYVAHAVGSVIWVYSVPSMTSAMWLGLLPIACAERLFYACAIACTISAVTYAQTRWQNVRNTVYSFAKKCA